MADSQMYHWIDKCVNPLGGECIHKCVYCYMNAMKRFPVNKEKYSGEPRIDEKGLAEIKGEGGTIFVGSATDLFAENVPEELIHVILDQCIKEPFNNYLLQTKHPSRYLQVWAHLPHAAILGVTIEGTDAWKYSFAPSPNTRIDAIKKVSYWVKKTRQECHFRTHVSIEPVIRWEDRTIQWLQEADPDIISIGGNTSKVDLDEPNADELLELIERMRQITPDLRLKDNLSRILGKEKLAEVQDV